MKPRNFFWMKVGESSAAETTLYIGIGKNIPRQKFREPTPGILYGIIPAPVLIPWLIASPSHSP